MTYINLQHTPYCFEHTQSWTQLLYHIAAGASFLAVTTNYTALGSPFVAPSAAAKAGVEALTK